MPNPNPKGFTSPGANDLTFLSLTLKTTGIQLDFKV